MLVTIEVAADAADAADSAADPWAWARSDLLRVRWGKTRVNPVVELR
jgi:hypothetical protein